MRILFLALVAWALLATGAAAQETTDAAYASPEKITGVAEVVQADQIVINGELISIFGIDAPDPGQDEECRVGRKLFGCYSNARRMMEILIDEGPFTCTPEGTANYVDVPYMSCTSGSGADIGFEMVSSGVALAFRPQSDRYVGVEEDARANRRGLWQPGILFTIPWEWRTVRSLPIYGP